MGLFFGIWEGTWDTFSDLGGSLEQLGLQNGSQNQCFFILDGFGSSFWGFCESRWALGGHLGAFRRPLGSLGLFCVLVFFYVEIFGRPYGVGGKSFFVFGVGLLVHW